MAWIGRTIWRGATTAGDDAVGEATTEQNKGMKLTSVEHIGHSQLIPGVLRTTGLKTRD